MAHEHHAASGRLRTEEEIRAEIMMREHDNLEYQSKMADLPVASMQRKAMKMALDTNVHLIAVLRWVLGEDLLWE